MPNPLNYHEVNTYFTYKCSFSPLFASLIKHNIFLMFKFYADYYNREPYNKH